LSGGFGCIGWVARVFFCLGVVRFGWGGFGGGAVFFISVLFCEFRGGLYYRGFFVGCVCWGRGGGGDVLLGLQLLNKRRSPLFGWCFVGQVFRGRGCG